jgi:S1-C subfamily serine protease
VIVIVVIVAIAALLAVDRADPSSSPGHDGRRVLPVDPAAAERATKGSVIAVTATLPGGAQATGTAVVLTSGGQAITSYHAVADASSIRTRMNDTGREFPAHVLGFDTTDDIALLQIDGAGALHPVDLGDSSTVGSGSPVAVAGTSGIEPATVTSVHRSITAGDADDPNGIETLHDMIELNAPTRPGDTGAPVVDASSRVVAIVTSASHGRRFSEQGTGSDAFATPIDNIVAIADQIDAGENNATVHTGPRATLAMTLTAVPGGGTGVMVTAVSPGQTMIQPGDVIVSLDELTITTPRDLDAALNTHHPGDTVRIGFVDGKGVYRTTDATLRAGAS